MSVPRLQAPIVLVHGLLGYDQIKIGRWTLAEYWPGIPDLLRQGGNRVLTVRLSPTAGVPDRARQLRAAIDAHFPREAVHLIAHSMGGLDSRYMISKLDMAGRVLSLTSIGTPHQGSPFADWGIRKLERILKPALELFGITHEAFYDLTTERCRRFHEESTDAPSVRYFSIAGSLPAEHFGPQLRLCHRIVFDAHGDNDGLVSVTSATHGERLDRWQGDHLSLANWPHSRLRTRIPMPDRLPDYLQMLSRLVVAGF